MPRKSSKIPGHLAGSELMRTKRSTKPIRQLHDNAKLFLESVSIRGCGRISKTDSRFIRVLWITFLICTSVVLCLSVASLINEYLTYAVTVETFIEMDDPSEFPAITFYNHQHFSPQAHKEWADGRIQSPSDYNKGVRQKAAEKLNPVGDNRHKLNESKTLQDKMNESATVLTEFDNSKAYYENLNVTDAELIGHQRNQSLRMCFATLLDMRRISSGPGCHNQHVKVSQHSDPKYFNYFTIQFVRHKLFDVQEMALIIWLGPKEEYDTKHSHAFIYDAFHQTHGVRVALHEPGRKADLDTQGLSIEPGRANELIFDAIKYKDQPSPRKPCLIDAEDKFHDLDFTYQYDFELCLNTNIQFLIIAECKCMAAILPRMYKPNTTLPYCGRSIEGSDGKEASDRRMCANQIIRQSASIKRHLEAKGKCRRRCERVEYESSLANSRWTSAAWQLYWSQHTASENSATSTNSELRDFHLLDDYLNRDNLTSFDNNFAGYQDLFDKSGLKEEYTLLVVRRRNNDTVVKAGKLVLSLNALVSRIGGLSSLYIGMTFAIVIEIIEFFYMTLRGYFEWDVKLAPDIVQIEKRKNEVLRETYLDKQLARETKNRFSTDSDIRELGAIANSYFNIPGIAEEPELEEGEQKLLTVPKINIG